MNPPVSYVTKLIRSGSDFRDLIDYLWCNHALATKMDVKVDWERVYALFDAQKDIINVMLEKKSFG
jgi:hypothetical protein